MFLVTQISCVYMHIFNYVAHTRISNTPKFTKIHTSCERWIRYSRACHSHAVPACLIWCFEVGSPLSCRHVPSNNWETPMHLSIFTTFFPNTLVCPPNIFDKYTPVVLSQSCADGQQVYFHCSVGQAIFAVETIGQVIQTLLSRSTLVLV